MDLLVLGGTAFLGRAVVSAGLEAGHRVTTFTRGRSGLPPAGAVALHGDRNSVGDLDAALSDRRFAVVIDTSAQSVVSASLAAERLGYVDAYVFVSSLSAYRHWPPGPIVDETAPVWELASDDYGPMKAAGERILAAALGDRFLTVRAGLIVGPHDDMGRLPWWLRRVSRGGQVVVPDNLEQPIAFVDVRDLGGWLVAAAEQRFGGAVNATGPAGMTTLGGLLAACVDAIGIDIEAKVELIAVPEERLVAEGVQPWTHLPFWLPRPLAATTWDVGTQRARQLGLPSRPVPETVGDTWAWLSQLQRPPLKEGVPQPGLPPELEARLLACSAQV